MKRSLGIGPSCVSIGSNDHSAQYISNIKTVNMYMLQSYEYVLTCNVNIRTYLTYMVILSYL